MLVINELRLLCNDCAELKRKKQTTIVYKNYQNDHHNQILHISTDFMSLIQLYSASFCLYNSNYQSTINSLETREW